MNGKAFVFALAALSALSLNAANWRGLDDSNYYSGPKISEADLAGKVVMVDQWGINCPPCRALLPSMQKLWNANKAKPFMLIGAHCQGRNPGKVKELVDGIERGVFWPAADTSEWRWDFADWIFNSPEESVDPAWIADQKRRIEAGAMT